MSDAIRPWLLGLALTALGTVSTHADDDKPARPDPAPREGMEPFVPKAPRTAEAQARVDALRDYASGRSLEDQRKFRDAVKLYEQALRKEPDSLAVLRRLSRISFAQGRVAQGVEFSKRIIAADPNDGSTIRQLVAHFQFRKDPAGLEAFLKGVIASPKLDRASSAYILVQNDLGDLYAGPLQQFGKAADAYAKVMDALDDKAANRLAPGDLKRVLGADESLAYLKFGEVFFRARKFDDAAKAFRRGLGLRPRPSAAPFAARPGAGQGEQGGRGPGGAWSRSSRRSPPAPRCTSCSPRSWPP